MLGRDGVHGVGLRPGADAVVLYVSEADAAKRASLAARAGTLAAPHQVVVEESEEARGA